MKDLASHITQNHTLYSYTYNENIGTVRDLYHMMTPNCEVSWQAVNVSIYILVSIILTFVEGGCLQALPVICHHLSYSQFYT